MSKLKMIVAMVLIGLMVSCGGEKKKEKESFSYENKATTKVEEKKIPDAEEVLSDKEIVTLLAKNTCVACHKKDEKLIGPSYKEIAKRNYEDKRIVELIYKPEPENWPEYKVPMLALPQVPRGEAFQMARWINSLK